MYNLKHLRKQTGILLISVLFVIVLSTILPSSRVSAHPASEMTLSYDKSTSVLNVSIIHQVSDPEAHYIDTVIIRKNGNIYNSYDYTNQPTASSFTYSYDLNASDGDVIEVFTDCNLGGSLTKQLTVTSQGNASPQDPSLSLQDITYYQIFGIPFIVYLGAITLFLFILTAGLAILKRRGKINYPLKWHFWLAYIALLLAIVHGILGFLIYV